MNAQRFFHYTIRVYLVVFFLYMFLPLIIMSLATFNDSRFPTVWPWRETTFRWFGELWADSAMWEALLTSIMVGFGVLALAVPIGVSAGLFLSTYQGRAKNFYYSLMLSPLLTPGVIIGISTLIFWRNLGVSGGIGLTIIAQTTFIAAYVMLMVLARLQRFDRTQELAAQSLGATHSQIVRRILLPYLKPAIITAGVIAFLQSFENYNTTLFVRGFDTTLTVYIATKVRTGLTPAVNALGLIMILLTVFAAVIYEILRKKDQDKAGKGA